jgi:hypothetical protein
MEFLEISWNEAAALCKELSEKIEGEFDMFVGISRGGLVPLRILSDIKGKREIGIIGMGLYQGIGKHSGFPVITQELTQDISGKKILLIDDVADTGKSLVAAKDYLKRKGAKEVKIATLHRKPSTQIEPDFVVGTTDKWVVYPWERFEVESEKSQKN